MKYILTLILIIIQINIIQTSDISNNTNALDLTPYMKNYIITGFKKVPQANQGKLQFSFKMPIFPIEVLNTKLYFAYSQRFFLDWMTTETRHPVYDVSFMPEFFFLTNFNFNFKYIELKYINYGLKHMSNGGSTDGNEVAWGDRFFISTHFIILNSLDLNFKTWGNAFYDTTELDKYFGKSELRFNYKIKIDRFLFENINLSAMTRLGTKDNNNPLQVGLDIGSTTMPSIYIQWWKGYGERLSLYSKHTDNLRIGFIFPFDDFSL